MLFPPNTPGPVSALPGPVSALPRPPPHTPLGLYLPEGPGPHTELSTAGAGFVSQSLLFPSLYFPIFLSQAHITVRKISKLQIFSPKVWFLHELPTLTGAFLWLSAQCCDPSVSTSVAWGKCPSEQYSPKLAFLVPIPSTHSPVVSFTLSPMCLFCLLDPPQGQTRKCKMVSEPLGEGGLVLWLFVLRLGVFHTQVQGLWGSYGVG